MKNHLKVGAILIAILTVYSIIVYVIAANKAEKEKPRIERTDYDLYL